MRNSNELPRNDPSTLEFASFCSGKQRLFPQIVDQVRLALTENVELASDPQIVIGDLFFHLADQLRQGKVSAEEAWAQFSTQLGKPDGNRGRPQKAIPQFLKEKDVLIQLQLRAWRRNEDIATDGDEAESVREIARLYGISPQRLDRLATRSKKRSDLLGNRGPVKSRPRERRNGPPAGL